MKGYFVLSKHFIIQKKGQADADNLYYAYFPNKDDNSSSVRSIPRHVEI